jgi:AcrR family transcriptional regulator
MAVTPYDLPDELRGWREHAVSRSLDSARLLAEKRVQRFLDAALELMDSGSGRELTVQQVVDRSGQSIRSFYQSFSGKHALLLALFEESVRAAAEHLQGLIGEEHDPLERLHRFTVEYHRLCRPAPWGRPVRQTARNQAPTPEMGGFAQQLLTEHPDVAAQAYRPLVSLLEQVLDDAAAAGGIRAGLDHHRTVGVVFQTISFHAFSKTISGSPVRADEDDAAEELWDLLVHGIGATSTA